MKKLILAAVLGVAWAGLGETVTNVRGLQRPNSNLVDIYYDLNATDGGLYTVKVEIEGKAGEVNAASFTGDVGNRIVPGKNKRVVWDAGADCPERNGDVKAIVTAVATHMKGSHGKVQLWEGGPYWATTNIGAEEPWERGLYFWWGDTIGEEPEGNAFSIGFYSSNAPTTYVPTDRLKSEGWTTAANILTPKHDAARVRWGVGWRMPTGQEFTDLCRKCTWTWTTMNGRYGYVVQGQGAYSSASIFLPSGGFGDAKIRRYASSDGHYWASTPSTSSSTWIAYEYGSWCLYFDKSSKETHDYSARDQGMLIRPVRGHAK